MVFTSISREALSKPGKHIEFRVRLKTAHPESDTWREYELANDGWRLVKETGLPARLELDPIPPDEGFGAETDPGERWQLFARVELRCRIYSGQASYEEERLFDGLITEITPKDYGLAAVALDRLHILSRTTAKVFLEAEQIAIADFAPLAHTDEYDENTFGLILQESPDGFSTSGARRSWQPGDIRVFDDAGSEFAPGSYAIYPDSGVIRFHAVPESEVSVTGVRCYVEGTNDVSAVIAAALSYPADSGGPGIPPWEMVFPVLGYDVNRVRWEESDGSVQDFVASIRQALPASVVLSYNSGAGMFTLINATQKETPDLSLMNPVSIAGPRTAHDVYTRVLIRGDIPVPEPLSSKAEVTDLMDGAGEIFKWEGNKKTFGAGSVSLIVDGNPNTGFGRHNLPGAPYDWRDYAQVDLGVPEDDEYYRVTRIDVVAANSVNPNSQSGANLIFLYGVEILGSKDGLEFVRVAPGAKLYLKPLETRTLEELTFDRFRYLKIRIKPAKDGLSNQNDPGLALNEIRVWGARKYTVEARVQDDDPDAPFYYPALVEKTSEIGHLTYIEDVGDTLDEYAARKRADSLLGEFIRSFQKVEYTSVVDPMVDVNMTAAVNDPATGIDISILVARVVHDSNTTTVSGTDYLAMPLS